MWFFVYFCIFYCSKSHEISTQNKWRCYKSSKVESNSSFIHSNKLPEFAFLGTRKKNKEKLSQLTFVISFVSCSMHSAGHFSMLGLGDIVMPGLLLCFVLRYDNWKRQSVDPAAPQPALITHGSLAQKVTYFHCSLIGYFVGKWFTPLLPTSSSPLLSCLPLLLPSPSTFIVLFPFPFPLLFPSFHSPNFSLPSSSKKWSA